MRANKLHTIRILHKIFNIWKGGRNHNELEIDSLCTLHVQQLIH